MEYICFCVMKFHSIIFCRNGDICTKSSNDNFNDTLNKNTLIHWLDKSWEKFLMHNIKFQLTFLVATYSDVRIVSKLDCPKFAIGEKHMKCWTKCIWVSFKRWWGYSFSVLTCDFRHFFFSLIICKHLFFFYLINSIYYISLNVPKIIHLISHIMHWLGI